MRKLIALLLLICSLHGYSQPNTLSNADKVYGLSRFWQEVNYNFVYLEKVNRAQWDSLYRSLITQVQQTPNDYEYYRLLQRFCAFLKDGHTNVYMPQSCDSLQMNTMFGKYRFFIENIEGKAIITRTNGAIKTEVPFGSEVIEVNGLPTASYLDQYVKPYIASSTDYVRDDQAIGSLLRGLKGQHFDIKIKTPAGKIVPLSLTHERTTDTTIYPAFTGSNQLMEVKWYPGDIAYVSLNGFGDSKIDTLFKQALPDLYKAKKLILDLRNNGGGSTGIGGYILTCLTNDTSFYFSKQVTRLHMPAFKAWGKYTEASDTARDEWSKKAYLSYRDKYYYEFENSPWTIHNELRKLVVPTVLLIGHNTASAAEDFLILADKQSHMTKIGQRTYGSTGQPFLFDLPGGGGARVCTKKDTYPDGREFVGYGVKPDIEVTPTLDDYRANRDAALLRALDYLKTK